MTDVNRRWTYTSGRTVQEQISVRWVGVRGSGPSTTAEVELCRHQASSEVGRCNDGLDNDCDGLPDELDPDCGGTLHSPPPPPPSPETPIRRSPRWG